MSIDCVRCKCIDDPNDPYHLEPHLCFVCGAMWEVGPDAKICPICNWVVCPECHGCRCSLSEDDAEWVDDVRVNVCQSLQSLADVEIPEPTTVARRGLGLQLAFCKKWAKEELRESKFTILGRRVAHPISADDLECFPAPEGVTEVTLECSEVTSLCPVTGQPDFVNVKIIYSPWTKCLETKSLKLYLWGFRDRGIFAESLSATIMNDLVDALEPKAIVVETTYKSRGGIVLTAVASRIA